MLRCFAVPMLMPAPVLRYAARALPCLMRHTDMLLLLRHCFFATDYRHALLFADADAAMLLLFFFHIGNVISLFRHILPLFTLPLFAILMPLCRFAFFILLMLPPVPCYFCRHIRR